jgi:glycine amidinotransferase
VMVERHEEALIQLLKRNGFQPICCNFLNFNTLGGSFHCATLDVRRRGGLESFF